MSKRKPFGVWWLLANGQPWNYCNERTIAEALASARALNGQAIPSRPLPLLEGGRAWIAAPAKVGEKGSTL